MTKLASSIRRYIGLILAVLSINPWVGFNLQPPLQQDGDPQVEAILQQMSPEDRIGQLFLVTFYGTDIGPKSDIALLISRYRIGGVVLLAQNDNFSDQGDLLLQVYQLTTGLQNLAAQQQQILEEMPGSPIPPSPYIPLFIGIEHEGSDGSHNHLRSGVSPLPSNMAIGATWNPAFAQATGQIVGEELAALGINLLLGPPADVVETPQPFTTGDLGTRVFGGEPFWVSRMTAFYVRGVHEGSRGRVAVVPRHFPGHGSADRLATVEVPTVRRSLAQLTQVDLQPFFAVTGNITDPLEEADGLMTGHIRYQGFQGENPRLLTRPISLDPQAMQALLRLTPIASWRDAGGLVVSDALGVRGIRRFYDPQEATFPNRRIAQDAFLAGNDLLYLGNFGLNPPSDQTQTVIKTIEFFVQTYKEDPAFQARVDESVRRILKKKLELYGSFTLNAVLPPFDGLDTLRPRREVTFNVAQNALTLLSPDQADLLTSPQPREHIVIFTDTRSVSQCSICAPRSLIAVDALQSAILRIYGPEGSGLISLADIRSFSFAQLDSRLKLGPPVGAGTSGEGATPQPDEIGIALDTADWVIFVMLDVDPNLPATGVVKSFLASPPVSPDTQIVVIAMGAPYYLDSTEIGKLAAYYATYGYTEPFVEVAARALFQGLPLNGSPPVSVSGIGYNILDATSPDPAQIIDLSVSLEPPETLTTGTPPPTEQVLRVRLEDTLFLTTGVIVDRNGHPVPDGTPAEFVFNYLGQGLRDTTSVVTTGGIARTTLVLNRPGDLEITVQSGEARLSTVFRFSVPDTGVGSGGEVPLDLPPSPTAIPVEPTATPTVLVVTPSPTLQPDLVAPLQRSVTFGDLFLSLFGLLTLSLVVFVAGLRRRDANFGLILTLPGIVTGLLGYNYYALLLPGTGWWRAWFGDAWGASLATWAGALIGFGLSYLILDAWAHLSFSGGRQRRR